MIPTATGAATTHKKYFRIILSIFILAATILSGCGGGAKVNPSIVATPSLGPIVSNPAVLCGTTGKIQGIDYLFLAQFHTGPVTITIHVLDLSQPASPKEVGSVDVTSASGEPLGILLDMKLQGNLLYASAGTFLLIVDVSNPAAPKELSRLDTTYALGRMALSQGYVFVATHDNILIADVSDPFAPKAAASYDIKPDGLGGFTASGTSLFVVAQGELHILDISSPLEPREIISLAPADSAGKPAVFAQIAVEGRYAYLSASAAGLFIMDVSNPRAPAQAGGMAWTDAGQISASGSLVFLIDRTAPVGTVGYQTWLRVINASNASRPELLASLNLNSDWQSFNFVTADDYLYWFGVSQTYQVVKIHATVS